MERSIIGIDLAKNVFQLHAEDAAGHVLWRTTAAPRGAGAVPRQTAAVADRHGGMWLGASLGPRAQRQGHEVRLMHAKYVKAYVKRGKSDLRDAEACCEAVQRSNMRFVPVKSVEQQVGRALERSRDLLVKQRTQIINATRGMLTEMGIVAGTGLRGFKALVARIDAGDPRHPGVAAERAQAAGRAMARVGRRASRNSKPASSHAPGAMSACVACNRSPASVR